MNKNQLIVAWVVAVIISTVLMVTPKMYYIENGYINSSLSVVHKLAPLTNWSIVLNYSLIVLIIGGLAIYTLRDKKK